MNFTVWPLCLEWSDLKPQEVLGELPTTLCALVHFHSAEAQRGRMLHMSGVPTRAVAQSYPLNGGDPPPSSFWESSNCLLSWTQCR